MSEYVRREIQSGAVPVTLVAGGSAAGYLIDAVQQHRDMKSLTPLTILYTARDQALIDWVAEVLAPLVRHVAMYNCHVVLTLTDGGAGDATVAEFVEQKQKAVDAIVAPKEVAGGELDRDLSMARLPTSGIQMRHGRLDFMREIPSGNIVFYQGSGGMRGTVETAAKYRNCRFVAGPSYDNDGSRKKSFAERLKFRKYHAV